MDDKSPGAELEMGATSWRVGDFELFIDPETVRPGIAPDDGALARGVSGRGWLHIPGAHPQVLDPPDAPFIQALEVVGQVLHPETEVALADGRRLRPDAEIGDTIAVGFDVDRARMRDILDQGRGVAGWLAAQPPAAQVAVEFRDVSLDVARHIVMDGEVSYPVAGLLPPPLRIEIAGFTLVISRFGVFAHGGARASASVILPPGVTDAASCGPAVIDLGVISLSPAGGYFFDEPAQDYGPWLLGDTGMVIGGTGFVLDLSAATSAPGMPPAWCGLVLAAGKASGAGNIPDPCNTGYLAGAYDFASATVDATGFAGTLTLHEPVSFTAINPFGQPFRFDSGQLDVSQSAIVSGLFADGSTELIPEAIRGAAAAAAVGIDLPSVSVGADLSLSAVLHCGGARVSWGELTHHGAELFVWSALADLAYLSLPAGAVASYSPVATGAFADPGVSIVPAPSLAALAAGGLSGVTFCNVDDIQLSTPDRPGGAVTPTRLGQGWGWLRAGTSGVDGNLARFSAPVADKLGDPTATGYVGGDPFAATLFQQDRINLLASFVQSAAYDSHVAGSVDIPPPADLKKLPFAELKITSTGCLVGGDIVLPPGGVTLPAWQVQLVSVAATGQAGVLSIRTGRLLITAGGISEPLHFARPIGLTWGEILASGSIGDLFLDHNDWGQRFDGLVFHPHEIALALPAPTEAYVGVWGSVLLPFFGLHAVNVRDGLQDAAHTDFARWVSVPPDPLTPHAPPTALALSGVWHDSTGTIVVDVECPVDVGYHELIQRGFKGTGTAAVGSLGADELPTVVEVRDDTSDVRYASDATHDFAVPAVVRVGAMREIVGSLRVEGATVSRMNVFGMLEDTAAVGWLLNPKTGYDVEVNTVITATSVDFYASGDMLLAVGLAQIEAAAVVHLSFDYAAGTAEGDLIGTLAAAQAFSGLQGSGQLTWFVGPDTMYLQGRVRVAVFVAFLSSESLEGGFFVGWNVPNGLAWALDTSDPRFKVSRSLFPARITGVYGYGRASYSKNYFLVANAGVDVFIGAGAFLDPPSAGAPLAPFAGGILPYVVAACGIGVHGDIAGGLVSVSAWAELAVRGPIPLYFEGTFGLSGCVAWVLCASITLAASYTADGLELTS